MPNGTVTQMEARLLKELVNREIHPIRCASSCGRKAQKGLMLGDLCAETRHLMWALKIWKFTLAEIHSKDYDDWIEVRFKVQYGARATEGCDFRRCLRADRQTD